MILSLYGHKGQKGIPRSTNEFINNAVDTASMSYKFGLETEAGYRQVLVERKFKRTKTGVSTSASRLQLMDREGVLHGVWDKTNDVTHQVEELIGLRREDFMRSVVLPQGRFSEFLTLEGKERRDMLERLLDLKAFGSQLQAKIKARGDYVKENMLQMEGEMKRFKELTPAYLEEKKTELDAAIKAHKALEETFRQAEKKAQDGERVYKLIKAIDDNKKQINQLLESQAEIHKKRQMLKEGVLAQKVWAYYKQFSVLEAEREKLLKEEASLKASEKTSKGVFEKCQEEYEAYSKTYAHEKEVLTIKKAEADQAGIDFEHAQRLTKERNELIANYKGIQKELGALKEALSSSEKKTVEYENKLETITKEKTENTVDQQKRESVSKGLQEEEKYKHNLELEKKQMAEKADVEALITHRGKTLEEMNAAYLLKNESIAQTEEKLEALRNHLKEASQKKAEGEQAISTKRHLLNEYSNKLSEKLKLEKEKERIQVQLQKSQEQTQTTQKSLERTRELYDKKQAAIAEYWQERVLVELSETLKEGQDCPLCGSHTHPHVYSGQMRESVDANSASTQLREAELAYERSRLETEGLFDTIKRLDKQLEAFGAYTEHHCKVLEAEVKAQSQENDALEKAIVACEKDIELNQTALKRLREEVAKTQTELNRENSEMTTLKTQREIGMKQLKELRAENEDIDQRYAFSKEGMPFAQRYERIKQMDEARQRLEKQEAELNLKLKQERENERKAREKYNALLIQAEKVVEKGSGLKERIEDLEKQVVRITGKRPVGEVLNDLDQRIDKLEKKNETLAEALKKADGAYRRTKSEYEAVRGKTDQIQIQYADAKNKYDGILKSSGFNTTQDLLEAHISEETLENIQTHLKTYENQMSILRDRVKELEKEKGDETIREEDWQNLKKAFESVKSELAEASEKKTTLQERFNQVEADMKVHESTLKRYQKFERAGDVVADLMDLVRGNKFVEYVALTHLKYIALDASERLMDITNHRYSLELDAKGNFIICDHYNGGVKRDTKTLSGGETFLTALSLSLALSSQIQLKGKTNLEFFFLDEGFGTLDGELLDTVMSSLEKLFEQKLTVGIISHVDELKNRVPIKLIVKPAEAGVRGTLTKIEVT
jgi:exonuclease SbcC